MVGPRQSGKTYLAKDLAKSFTNSMYLNYDQVKDREIIKNQSWLENTDLLILDELHKMPNWKNYLKGIFDTKPETMGILVTGSSRLDVYDRIGDSLAGRYFRSYSSNAELTWTRVRGFERLAEVIIGIKFTDGLTDAECAKLNGDRNAA